MANKMDYAERRPVYCVSDSYTPTRDRFASVEEFLEMCRTYFGQAPDLTAQDDGWHDQTGELVLVPLVPDTKPPLYVASFRGGDADHHTVARTTIWLDRNRVWRALVDSPEAARLTANNTGAELASCEEWDGDSFGDVRAGDVHSSCPGVLHGPHNENCGQLPKGWSWHPED